MVEHYEKCGYSVVILKTRNISREKYWQWKNQFNHVSKVCDCGEGSNKVHFCHITVQLITSDSKNKESISYK